MLQKHFAKKTFCGREKDHYVLDAFKYMTRRRKRTRSEKRITTVCSFTYWRRRRNVCFGQKN